MIGAITLFAGVASAHVSVQPQETSQGKYEVFTLRVPSESESPTTKVEVKFPKKWILLVLNQKQAGHMKFKKMIRVKLRVLRGQRKVKVLTATEFGQFNMQGKVGDKATEIVWKRYELYVCSWFQVVWYQYF